MGKRHQNKLNLMDQAEPRPTFPRSLSRVEVYAFPPSISMTTDAKYGSRQPGIHKQQMMLFF
jgi:hypothetical protein